MSLAALAPFIGNPAAGSGEILPRLLRAAREHLGLEVAFIAEFTDTLRVFRYVDDATGVIIRPGDGDPLEDSYCQRIVDGRLPELLTDAGEDPVACGLPITSELPVGAHVSVPLRLPDGRLYGTFCCFSRTPDETLTARDVTVLRLFADVAGQYLAADIDAAEAEEAIAARIRQAIEDAGALTMVFQPVVAFADRGMVGVEALARFAGPPARTPDLWFAEAEAIGLAGPLEARALRAAVEAVDALPEDTFLAVNASPAAVVEGHVACALAGVDLTRIVLEMTEHAPVADYAELRDTLQPLRRRGLRVAVDDAGAGYATLRHILRLGPEIIKLDASLTRDIDTDPAKRALATALSGFAREIGSRIIGEGVETESELTTLAGLGVDAAQGFHLGRPAPLDEVTRAISASERHT